MKWHGVWALFLLGAPVRRRGVGVCAAVGNCGLDLDKREDLLRDDAIY